jgi:hypothetical protein
MSGLVLVRFTLRTLLAMLLACALGLAGAALAAADPAVVADVQVIALPDDVHVIKIRSSGALPFDPLPPPASRAAAIRLHGAQLGDIASPLAAPFGTVTFTSEPQDRILVRLDFVGPGYRAAAQQGGTPGTVDIRVTFVPGATPPIVSNAAAAVTGPSTATLTWTSDEPADSRASYRLASGGTATTVSQPALVTSHTINLSGLTAGTLYAYEVTSADDSGNVSAPATGTFTTQSAALAFQESGGRLTMEAERAQQIIPRSGQDWVPGSGQSGFAGSGYVEALPATGAGYDTGYVTTSPELVFRARFATPGTYHVWVRGAAPTTSDDSVHAGVDGTGPASADRISGFGTGWTWRRTTMDGNSPATLSIPTAGIHTIHLWVREDGVKVDRVHLTTSTSSTAPSGSGPAESPLAP